jgi:hypothetical protein
MLIRTVLFLVLFSAIIFLTYSFPGHASTYKVNSDTQTDCTEITYKQVNEDGACWLYVYCDGILVNKYPISDGACQ